MLTDKQDQGLINGLVIAQTAPKISHLFFADDNIIFCKANEEEATQLKAVFEEYYRISGHKVNFPCLISAKSVNLYSGIGILCTLRS
jgi:hypothetical protein